MSNDHIKEVLAWLLKLDLSVLVRSGMLPLD